MPEHDAMLQLDSLSLLLPPQDVPLILTVDWNNTLSFERLSGQLTASGQSDRNYPAMPSRTGVIGDAVSMASSIM